MISLESNGNEFQVTKEYAINRIVMFLRTLIKKGKMLVLDSQNKPKIRE